MAREMETLAEATTRLADSGYVSQFLVRGDHLECRTCDDDIDPGQLTIDEVERFEGMSDPDDEAVLFAVTSDCGHKGTLVAAYGPEMTAEEAAVIRKLHERS